MDEITRIPNMSAFQTHIVDRFEKLYGPPQTSDLPGFLADYKRELAGIDQGILREASDTLVRTHQYRNWPTIAECLAAVRTATRWRAVANELKAAAKPEPERKAPSSASAARIDAMIAQFKAHAEKQETAGERASVMLPLNHDQWTLRQRTLRAAGKWASSFVGSRAA
jgi:hypothetical protein